MAQTTIHTKIIKLDPERFDAAQLDEPARALREGRLVAFPTETVYGIGVNLDDAAAVDRLYQVKQRPREKVLTVHIGDRDDIVRLVKRVPPSAERLMRKFWPGPLTLIFPSDDPNGLGVRYPNHKVAQELLRRARCKVGAPSANISGDRAATTPEEVIRGFDGKVDYIITAGPTKFRGASTVVRTTGRKMEVLREGAINKALIDELNYEVVLFVCTGNTCRSPMAEMMFRELVARKYGVKPEEIERVAGVKVLSAGTNAAAGGEMAANSRAVLEEMGFHPGPHSSEPLGIGMIQEADHIFVMEQDHRERILEWLPELEPRVHLMDPAGKDVRDPVWGDLNVYRECAKAMNDMLNKRMKDF